jgi:hypothetical protein
MGALNTREREIKALKEAMDETGISQATVVTLEKEETVSSPPHDIRGV